MYHNWCTGTAVVETAAVAAAVTKPAAAPWTETTELLLTVAGPTEADVAGTAVAVPRQPSQGRLNGRRRRTAVGGLSAAAAAGAAARTRSALRG